MSSKRMRVLSFFAGLALGAILGACHPAPAAQVANRESSAPNHVQMAQDLTSKTVALVKTTKTGEVRAYCSGVWVGYWTILTANHCVMPLKVNDDVDYVVRADVYAPGSNTPREGIDTHGAVIIAIDSDHDLVLLRAFVPPRHEVTLLSTEIIAQGLPVMAMGQPLGMWWSFSSGEVAAVRVIDNAFDIPMLFVQSTVPISPGSSGGGLFDEWGGLVGITHASFNDGENMNLFIHRVYIASILASVKAGGL